jgi:YD repeat-containing protein
VLTAYDYDDANRILSIKTMKVTENIAEIQYTHDNNGNRLTRSTLLGTQAFTYDNLNQVIRAVYESGNLEEFVYDNNGNREKHITRESLSADPGDDSFHVQQPEPALEFRDRRGRRFKRRLDAYPRPRGGQKR